MPSSATTRNRLEKQATGENANTWGAKLNTAALDLIDEALDGFESIAVTGNLSLTSANYVTDQARKRFLKFTGTVAANITLPGVSKLYFVWNAGSQPLTFTTGGSDTAVVPSGARFWVACDGVGVWADTSAAAAASAAADAAAALAAGTLPSVTGQAGKYLFTNGTAASWAEVPGTLPSVSGQAGKYLFTNGTAASWEDAGPDAAQARTVNISGTSFVDIGSASVTLAAGDTVLVDLQGYVSNDTGVDQTTRFRVQIGSFNIVMEELLSASGFSYPVALTARIGILSASEACISIVGSFARGSSVAGSVARATDYQLVGYNTTTTNLTGTRTVSIAGRGSTSASGLTLRAAGFSIQRQRA